MADINLQEVNDKSLEIMADIIEPYFELMKDKEFSKLFTTDVVKAIKYACKEHKEQVIEIGAVLKGVPVDKFVVDPFTLPVLLISTIGTYSKISADLFTSQAQNLEETSSGSAMENTGAGEQPINS